MSNQHFQSVVSAWVAFPSCFFHCFSPSKSPLPPPPWSNPFSHSKHHYYSRQHEICLSLPQSSADRNPRDKVKEQQIRRFAECQHSNGSEKYKTELLTTQGNKCSCGKNHTLMPISLIALWFRQRAERWGVWAPCAAVPQPSCRLGGWMLAVPLVVFAFSFAV